jgi:hypothetical protein
MLLPAMLAFFLLFSIYAVVYEMVTARSWPRDTYQLLLLAVALLGLCAFAGAI